MLLTFGSRCNRYFWDIRLKILRLPNFNMLFQLVLLKFFKSELFSCIPKVDHVITVMQRAYCCAGPDWTLERQPCTIYHNMDFLDFAWVFDFWARSPFLQSPDNLSSPKSNANRNKKNKSAGPGKQNTPLCFFNWYYNVRCKTIETSIFHDNNNSFTGPLIIRTFEKRVILVPRATRLNL